MQYLYCSTIDHFVNTFSRTDQNGEFVLSLTNKFLNSVGELPSCQQQQAWSGMFPHVLKFCKLLQQEKLGEIFIVLEYFLPFSDERIDMILLGRGHDHKPVAIVFELKGWQGFECINNLVVQVNKEIHQNPELQVKNYVGKLMFTHSASSYFSIEGCLWLYNLTDRNHTFNVQTFYKDDFESLVNYVREKISGPLNEDTVNSFLNGYYTQTTVLFETLKMHMNRIKQDALNALCNVGFTPSEDQAVVLNEILEAVRNNDRKCFLIQGEPGSGKTYLAILLLLEIVKNSNSCQQNLVVLGYRNNRLINTIRNIFSQAQSGLDTLVKFYSTGRNTGIAENGNSSNLHFKVAIYDEAQRMTKENISIAMQRSDIVVFFYDEKQILNPDEEGWRINFLETAEKLKVPCKEIILRGIYRVRGGKQYHEFMDHLLSGQIRQETLWYNSPHYDFVVFEDINRMIQELQLKVKNGKKVALIASFTESPGDKERPTARSINNRRIGYPLKSGFDIYKDTRLDIYWLMDPKIQYPQFWLDGKSNELKNCSSIYGCQGFEADYVGVIWGRDFVWRDGKWVLGDNCEDNVGNPSLKKLFSDAKNGNQESFDLAIKLLVNRYRIFLSRGILGTFVYCEDEETRKYLLSITKRGAVNEQRQE